MSQDNEFSRDDEQELIDCTVTLKNQYESLDRIIVELESEPGRSVDSISEQLKRIKKTEARLQPLRESYQKHHQQTSGRVKEVTDETISVVKDLMPKLANLEKASVESLRRLFPKIQGSVRAVQMQNAYKGNLHP